METTAANGHKKSKFKFIFRNAVKTNSMEQHITKSGNEKGLKLFIFLQYKKLKEM